MDDNSSASRAVVSVEKVHEELLLAFMSLVLHISKQHAASELNENERLGELDQLLIERNPELDEHFCSEVANTLELPTNQVRSQIDLFYTKHIPAHRTELLSFYKSKYHGFKVSPSGDLEVLDFRSEEDFAKEQEALEGRSLGADVDLLLHELLEIQATEPFIAEPGTILWTTVRSKCPQCKSVHDYKIKFDMRKITKIQKVEVAACPQCKGPISLPLPLRQEDFQDLYTPYWQHHRVREIGSTINSLGSYNLMEQVAHHFRARGGNPSELSRCWHEIGGWMS